MTRHTGLLLSPNGCAAEVRFPHDEVKMGPYICDLLLCDDYAVVRVAEGLDMWTRDDFVCARTRTGPNFPAMKLINNFDRFPEPLDGPVLFTGPIGTSGNTLPLTRAQFSKLRALLD